MGEKGEAYEIFLHDVPDGAETLLIEGETLSVRGSLNGSLTGRYDYGLKF